MKIAMFTDIHFGCHQNSEIHNQAALRTVQKFIDVCDERDVDCAVFLGDWHDHRTLIEISTLHYSSLAIHMLSEYFSGAKKKLFFLIGNHDLYYRDKSDITSIPFRSLRGIEIVDSPAIKTVNGERIAFLPWVGNELPENILLASEQEVKYLFGHLEVAGFHWNQYSRAFTKGSPKELFRGFKGVFSGHYHTRQTNGNVTYIGSSLQINFADTNEQRGFAILDTDDNSVEYIENDVAPKFLKMTLTEALENLDALKGNYVRVSETTKLSADESELVHAALLNAGAAKIIIEPYREDDESESDVDQSIDISSVESTLFKLIDMDESVDRDHCKKVLQDVLENV